MSGPRRDFSPVDSGYVRIERRADGSHRVTVLRSPEGTSPDDVVSVHLRCRKVEVDDAVRLVGAGATRRSLAPVEIYQSYRTKTVVIRPAVESDSS